MAKKVVGGKKRTYRQGVKKEASIVSDASIMYQSLAKPILFHEEEGTGHTKKVINDLTPLEKMQISNEGISKSWLEILKQVTALDYDYLAKALSVTRTTLINKKKEEKFTAALSERIVDLADVYSYGYDVFEDKERFNEWMFRPNRGLGGQVPYDLMGNQFGRQEVRNIIGRIDYGVYS